jgi:hypothetical protein
VPLAWRPDWFTVEPPANLILSGKAGRKSHTTTIFTALTFTSFCSIVCLVDSLADIVPAWSSLGFGRCFHVYWYIFTPIMESKSSQCIAPIIKLLRPVGFCKCFLVMNICSCPMKDVMSSSMD